jgi:hypothetical protein
MSTNFATGDAPAREGCREAELRRLTSDEINLLDRFESLSNADKRAIAVFAERLRLRANYHASKSLSPS